MEQSQPNKRREADQEFQASLEQLEDILQENSTEEEDMPIIPTDDVDEVETDIDLADLGVWEDAVADIENYLEARTKRK